MSPQPVLAAGCAKSNTGPVCAGVTMITVDGVRADLVLLVRVGLGLRRMADDHLRPAEPRPPARVATPKAASISPATIDAIAVVAITRRFARLVVTAAPIGAAPPERRREPAARGYVPKGRFRYSSPPAQRPVRPADHHFPSCVQYPSRLTLPHESDDPNLTDSEIVTMLRGRRTLSPAGDATASSPGACRTEGTHCDPRSTREPVCADLSGLRARENPGRGLRCEHQFGSMWLIPSGPGFEVPDSSKPRTPTRLSGSVRCPEGGSMSAADEQRRSSTALLEAAADALDGLAALDLDTLAGDDLTDAVLRLQELRGAFDVAEARVLARWDTLGEWRPSGAKTAAAWLAWKQRIPIGVARQRLRHGGRCATCRPWRRRGRPARSTGRTSPRCWASAPHAPRRRSSATTRSCWTRPARSASSTSRRTAIAGSCSSIPTVRSRTPRRITPPRGAPVQVVRGHVVRQADPRPDLRRDRRTPPCSSSSGSSSRPTGPPLENASAGNR